MREQTKIWEIPKVSSTRKFYSRILQLTVNFDALIQYFDF